MMKRSLVAAGLFALSIASFAQSSFERVYRVQTGAHVRIANITVGPGASLFASAPIGYGFGLIKYDALGREVWRSVTPPPPVDMVSVMSPTKPALLSDGSVIVPASWQGVNFVGAGVYVEGARLARFSAEGQLLWVRDVVPGNSAYRAYEFMPNRIALFFGYSGQWTRESDLSICVAIFDFAGNRLRRNCPALSQRILWSELGGVSDSGLLIGTGTTIRSGGADAHQVAFDFNGNTLWEHISGWPGTDDQSRNSVFKGLRDSLHGFVRALQVGWANYADLLDANGQLRNRIVIPNYHQTWPCFLAGPNGDIYIFWEGVDRRWRLTVLDSDGSNIVRETPIDLPYSAYFDLGFGLHQPQWGKHGDILIAATGGHSVNDYQSIGRQFLTRLNADLKQGPVTAISPYEDLVFGRIDSDGANLFFSSPPRHPNTWSEIMRFRVVATRYDGDVNGDGCTDDADLAMALKYFGQETDEADCDGNGRVDEADLYLVVLNFGLGCE